MKKILLTLFFICGCFLLSATLFSQSVKNKDKIPCWLDTTGSTMRLYYNSNFDSRNLGPVIKGKYIVAEFQHGKKYGNPTIGFRTKLLLKFMNKDLLQEGAFFQLPDSNFQVFFSLFNHECPENFDKVYCENYTGTLKIHNYKPHQYLIAEIAMKCPDAVTPVKQTFLFKNFEIHPDEKKFFVDLSATDNSFLIFTNKLDSAVAKQDTVLLLTLLADTLEGAIGYDAFKCTKKDFIMGEFNGKFNYFVEFIAKHTRFGFKRLNLNDSDNTVLLNDSRNRALATKLKGKKVFVNYPFLKGGRCAIIITGLNVVVRDTASLKGKVLDSLSWECVCHIGMEGEACEGIPDYYYNEKERTGWYKVSLKNGSTGWVNEQFCLTAADSLTCVIVVKQKNGWKIKYILTPPGC